MSIPPLPRTAGATPSVVSLHELRARCSNCSMRELCLPYSLDAHDLHQLDQLVATRQRLKKGDILYRAGDSFTALHAVKLGSTMTTVLAEDGREQVCGYHLPGDLFGLDGIDDGHHKGQSIALEDSEICSVPLERLEELARHVPALQHNLHRFLSREIDRDHNIMLLLGSMRAEERLAAFLLNLAHRYRQRGYSSTEFVLRMTREEIGSFLGLKLETVSRLFSRFQQEGLIQAQGRAVKLLDVTALKQLAGQRA
jgi:CRP/FNR family transcriptional regulator